MRGFTVSISFAALLASAGIAASAPAELSVRLPQEPGFMIGNQARSGRQILVEMVPVGQTVNSYDRLISLQTMPGMGTVPAPDMVAQFARRYSAGCPRSTMLMVPMGRDRGVRIDCPRHPNTGKTETVFARAIPVGPDMAMTQITLKYSPLPRDAQWARDYLGRVSIQ